MSKSDQSRGMQHQNQDRQQNQQQGAGGTRDSAQVKGASGHDDRRTTGKMTGKRGNAIR
jgi:hypothetical protein